jgi:hypothetical protein
MDNNNNIINNTNTNTNINSNSNNISKYINNNMDIYTKNRNNKNI